jgi:hypothetical protein
MADPENPRNEIYHNLNLRETEDLVQIWQENNRYEWTEEAMQIVGEILQARLGELPPQNAPTLETPPAKDKYRVEDGSPLDAHLDDEDLPEFYDPWKVLRLEKWMVRGAWGLIIVVSLQTLLQFSNYQRMALGWFFSSNTQAMGIAGIIGLLFIVLNIGIEFVIVYLPLRALAEILKILMEMEFASRGMRKYVEG